MSIWVKTASATWTQIQSIYTKIASASWAENLSVWVKTGASTWIQVFNRINIPSISTTPKIRDISGNNIDNNLYISNIGDTLVGYRGTWNGSPTSYEYRWMWSNMEGGTLSAFSPAQSGTFSGTTTNLLTVQAWDDRYVYLQVRATNSLGTSDWVTSSNFAHIIKYAPFIYNAKIFRGATELSGTTATVSSGQTLTGTYSEITTADQVSDTYLYEWYYADGTLISSSSFSTTYTTTLADVGKSIYFKVTGSNTGGEGSATSLTTSLVQAGYPGYTFSMGNTIHVGTNGYIGLTSGSSVRDAVPSTGTVIAIQTGDFVVSDIRRWSSSNAYAVTVDSYKYNFSGQAAYRLKYQAVFYTNQNYMDYKIINFGSSLTTMGYFGIYYNGALVGSAYPGPFVYGTNTTIRVYYDGTAPAAYLGLLQSPPDAAMIQITSPTVGTSDDGYYSITTSANEYATPFNTLGTISTTSDQIYALSLGNGNDFSYQQYVVRTGSHSGTLVTSGTINSSAFSVSGLSSGTTYYVTVTPYNTMGQAGSAYQFSATTVSSPQAFNITSVTKTKPASVGGLRTITVNWNASTNATKYEFQIEGSTNASTWTVLVFDAGDGNGSKTWDLASSPYYDYGTGSKTFSNVTYYPYYRVTMRARGSDLNLANSVYSNGGTSTSLSYVQATGTAPGKPTLTTPTGTDLTSTSVNINYTYPTDTGSNHIDWIQFSTDQITWSNDFSSPYTLTTTANTSYTVYARSLNYDGLLSATPHNSVTFTTPKALAPITSLSATTTTKTGITLTFGGGYGDTYEYFFNNANSATDTTSYSRPTTASAADFSGITSSPYTTNLTTRGVHRRFWMRSRVGTTASVWYPDGNGTVGAGIYGYAPLYAPSAPTSLTATKQSTSRIDISWTAPTTGTTNDAATGYDIYYSTSSTAPSASTTPTTTSTTTSAQITSLSASTTYYFWVRGTNADNTGSSAGAWSSSANATTDAQAVLYTVTFNTNGASGSPSVSSVTQSTQGGSVVLATIGTMSATNSIFGGWRTGTNGGTRYAFGATFTPTSDITLYAYYGTTPTCSAPALNFRRFPGDTSSGWEYFCDYPTPSGAYQSIDRMQYEIYSNSTGTTLITYGSGTMTYPGSATYPYTSSRLGSIWAFRVASGAVETTDSNYASGRTRAATTAARYGRVRVQFTGIDGVSRNGTWTSPLL